jgi:hypothetical protein
MRDKGTLSHIIIKLKKFAPQSPGGKGKITPRAPLKAHEKICAHRTLCAKSYLRLPWMSKAILLHFSREKPKFDYDDPLRILAAVLL